MLKVLYPFLETAQEEATNVLFEFHLLIRAYLNIHIFQELLPTGTASPRR